MKYKVYTQWGNYKKYAPRIGELFTEGYNTEQILENILRNEQNEITPRQIPSASSGDIIELEDGRNYKICDIGFAEVKL